MKVQIQTTPYLTCYWTCEGIKKLICILVLTPSLKALGPIVGLLVDHTQFYGAFSTMTM
jgi:hypothetical protein